jgi:hypothetical protein
MWVMDPTLLCGDQDFYELRLLDQSQLVSIDVETTLIGSDLRPVLVAYDRKGKVLAYADGSSTDDDAHLTLPAGCMSGAEGPEGNLVLMVMGIQQRLPNDPFDPFEVDYFGRVGENRVTDGSGSTGVYRLQVTSVASDGTCASEPDWGFDSATPANDR